MILSHLPKGRTARIVSFQDSTSSLYKRLRTLGFEEGALVEILHYGFPAHDPIAVRLEDHTIALGKEEAGLIQVQKV